MRILCNTYPHWPNVAHGEIGDECRWSRVASSLCLVRINDEKTVYSRNWDKNDERPVVGVIAQVKSKGWMLQIEDEIAMNKEVATDGN